MNALRAHDLWGLISAMLVLILVYLILSNWMGAQSLLNTTLQGGNTLARTLQGR